MILPPSSDTLDELTDGQHPNFIDGIWHCSNCGCPEGIAIGRRKGPLGDKSQCGACGKFWHRHQRPRPVTYNPDPVYHLSLGVSPSIQLNGTGHSESHSNTPMPPPATDDVPPPLPGHSDRPKSPVHPSEELPPHSLIEARAAMNAKYLDDRFDIWPRTAPTGEREWRVKCLDCPGKLYIPGDGMSNFEVHLKNRNHRARVAERLGTTRTHSSHDQR